MQKRPFSIDWSNVAQQQATPVPASSTLPLPDFSTVDCAKIRQDMINVLQLPLGRHDPVLFYVEKACVFDRLNPDNIQIILDIYGKSGAGSPPRATLVAFYEVASNERRKRQIGIRAFQLARATRAECRQELADLDKELGFSLRLRLEDNHDIYTLLRLSEHSRQQLQEWPDLTEEDIEHLETVLQRHELAFLR